MTKKIKIFHFSFFIFFNFFSKKIENFLRIFDLAITYRRTRDPHQIHRSKKLSPEINSDQNLNGRSLIKNSLFKRKCTNMLQALRMHTFLTPYYSSSRGWDILLYESLGNFLFRNGRFYNKFTVKFDKKIENFNFFTFFNFRQKFWA